MSIGAAVSRLIPHPPNFTPIAAIALFAGAQFTDKRAAFLVPVASLFLSDLILGLHRLIPLIYLTFCLIVCIGFVLRRRHGAVPIATGALISAVLFFALTNFGVWLLGNLYPKTVPGLVECYMAAIPFFWNTLLSDLFYSTLLFGGIALAETRFVAIRKGRADAR